MRIPSEIDAKLAVKALELIRIVQEYGDRISNNNHDRLGIYTTVSAHFYATCLGNIENDDDRKQWERDCFAPIVKATISTLGEWEKVPGNGEAQ